MLQKLQRGVTLIYMKNTLIFTVLFLSSIIAKANNEITPAALNAYLAKMSLFTAYFCADALSDPGDCANQLGSRSMQIYGRIQSGISCGVKAKRITHNLYHFIDNTDFQGVCNGIKYDSGTSRRRSFEQCQRVTQKFFEATQDKALAAVTCS
jgi:hypothetical protein